MNSLNKEKHKKLIEEMNLKTEKEIKNTNRKKLAIKNDINNISGKEINNFMKPKNFSVNNVQIPEGTHPWRNQKIPEIGTIFTDDLFPPKKSNLCELNYLGQWEMPEDVEYKIYYNLL